jgi:hypothetical protein
MSIKGQKKEKKIKDIKEEKNIYMVVLTFRSTPLLWSMNKLPFKKKNIFWQNISKSA